MVEIVSVGGVFLFITTLCALFFWKQVPTVVKEEPLEEVIPAPIPEPLPVEPPKPMEKTNREKLYDVAFGCLGVDMAPTQDFVGCAEALSFVMKKAGVKGLPPKGILSTAELNIWLSKHLTRIEVPEFGDIAMFPTGAGNGSVRGHCFVVGKHRWMSNNSNTTLWDDHWTPKDVLAYYHKKGGITPRYYRWI